MVKYTVNYKLENGHFRYLLNSKLYTAKELPNSYVDGKFVLGNFRMPKGYEESDDGLMEYLADFKLWCDQLRGDNYICQFDYDAKMSHTCAAEQFCMKYCKNAISKFPTISQVESTWIEKTYNGGLMYCNPQTEFTQSYSYDRNSFNIWNKELIFSISHHIRIEGISIIRI